MGVRCGSSRKEKKELSDRFNSLQDQIKINTDQLSLSEKSIINKSVLLKSTKAMEPPWYIKIIECFTKGQSYKDWKERCINIINEQYQLDEKMHVVSEQIQILKIEYNQIELCIKKLKKTEQEKIKRHNECFHIISTMKDKYQWYSEIPDQKFWSQEDADLQITSPWMHKELQDVRAQLFVDAMNLHKSFIINTSSKMINNLKLAKYLMTNDNLPAEFEYLISDIYTSFFLVVPTISTTFASFSNLFRYLKANSLGYVLIDEAGQSSPQAAVGAIYRSKRTIVVGDPLQIPPVVTTPTALNTALLRYYNVETKWNALEESAQTIADRANVFGTFLGSKDKSPWIGCPLRVHRRCIDPMFRVSNMIAYDNLMIQATPYKKSSIEDVLPESLWVNVNSNKFDGKWSEDEAEVVLQLLKQFINSQAKLPSIYIISPFNIVANNMKRYLWKNTKTLAQSLSSIQRQLINDWIKKSVGTVHTFQGKQADGVILLLGGDPNNEAGIDWASDTPNLLNVAITRAKNLLFVVGNYDRWSMKPNFQQLSMSMKKVESTDLSFKHNGSEWVGSNKGQLENSLGINI